MWVLYLSHNPLDNGYHVFPRTSGCYASRGVLGYSFTTFPSSNNYYINLLAMWDRFPCLSHLLSLSLSNNYISS